MAVPDDKFASFLKFYQEKLDASGLEYVIFGHIGDNHLHANMIPKTDAEAEKSRHLYGRFIAQAIMLGGTAGLVACAIGVIWIFTSGRLHRHENRRFLLTLAAYRPSVRPGGDRGYPST